jgi:hypothetical protein
VQKHRIDLAVRTIGLADGGLEIGTVNLVYNIKRTLWLGRRAASG